MFKFDPLAKIRKWLTTSKDVSTEGKWFADAKSIKDLKDDIDRIKEVLSPLLVASGSIHSEKLTNMQINTWSFITMPKSGLLVMEMGTGYWQVVNIRTGERFSGYGSNNQNIDTATLFVLQGDSVRYYAEQHAVGYIYY